MKNLMFVIRRADESSFGDCYEDDERWLDNMIFPYDNGIYNVDDAVWNNSMGYFRGLGLYNLSHRLWSGSLLE